MQADLDQYGVMCWQVLLESGEGEQSELRAVCGSYLRPASAQESALEAERATS